MLTVLEDALTFDDVLLVPDHSLVLPADIDLSAHLTSNLSLNIPLISAAMDTVTESRLAISIAQEGGLGIIHKNMTIERQAAEVRAVKKFESGIVSDPITAKPTDSIRELLDLTCYHGISGVPVVDGHNLVGIVTSRDVRFATNLDEPIASIMTQKDRLVTVQEGTSHADIQSLLHEYRIEKVLIVNDAFELKGLITVKDIQKAQDKPNACKDEQSQLRCGAAVGVGGNTEERIEALVEAGVDAIVVDTAHGHSQGVIDRVAWARKHFSDLQIIAGNIATAGAAKMLRKAGANAVKVGVGPGSICTTRVISGVGVPQLTAISNVAKELKGSGVGVIADGGIRFSGDITKALAAGANCVMIGGLFAGTEESPGDVELFQGRSYKNYRGMGSMGAMKQGSSDRYFQEGTAQDKMVPEGIEGRVPYKGPLLGVVHQLTGGIRSGMGYTGCESIKALNDRAKFVKISSSGVNESHVHDVTITKQPPNYQLKQD